MSLPFLDQGLSPSSSSFPILVWVVCKSFSAFLSTRAKPLTAITTFHDSIGKGGAKIKEIQEASGARLNASEAMLPGSTEVSVTLEALLQSSRHLLSLSSYKTKSAR